MIKFNAALEECPECQQKWNMPNSLDSWYQKMLESAEAREC